MNDGASAVGKAVDARAPVRAVRSLSWRTAQPRHRRRQALALVCVAAVALTAGVLTGASASHRAARSNRVAHVVTRAGTPARDAEQIAQNAAIDRTLGYTPYVRVAGSQHREIALTFDDGPGPYTQTILATLERFKVPATFFEVGVLEGYFHAATTAITRDGDPIEDHTHTHAPMGRLAPRDQRAQLLQQVSATGAYGVPFPRMFRPPYGSWDGATLRLLRRYRMLMVLWTVDANDYRRPGTAAIVHSVISGARPGAIILLHDAGGDRAETVAALPRIIRKLRARGYRLVTVPKLLLDNPAPRNQQISSIVGSGG